jgi:hypothetical protein
MTKPTTTAETRPFRRRKSVTRCPGRNRPTKQWPVAQRTPATRARTAAGVEPTPIPRGVRSLGEVVRIAVTVVFPWKVIRRPR